MKKVLFVDRDGTLVVEPPLGFQLDSLKKLEFLPGVFRFLGKIVRELDYELVMVTNQDGLGTKLFPEETFWPAHDKMMKAFANEGIVFSNVLIDRTLPEENAETRKPNVGLLSQYIYGDYDLTASFVLGDRETDMQLAHNLGAQGISIGNASLSAAFNASSWEEIYHFLKGRPRQGEVKRVTSETSIEVKINLDGNGKNKISTGIGFFDHMLAQVARHAVLDLIIFAKSDLEVDEHHTIEDVALTLGEVFKQALGSKKGIHRYGFLLPMDDCLAQVAIDFGGRPWLVWDAEFRREKIGEMPTEMFMHFFKSFSDAAGCNLNIKAEGENEHHKIESIFKAFSKAIRMAINKTTQEGIPSTKGIL